MVSAGIVYDAAVGAVAFNLGEAPVLTPENFTPNQIRVSTNFNAQGGYSSISVEASIAGTATKKTWNIGKKTGNDTLPVWLSNIVERSAVEVLDPANRVVRKQ